MTENFERLSSGAYKAEGAAWCWSEAIPSCRPRGVPICLLLPVILTMVLCGHTNGLCEAMEPDSDALTLDEIMEMDIEDLLSIRVTSVSRKEENQYRTAAAIYVITGEDIRRSGATSIAEALRLAPGMQVARVNGSKWVITSRGFAYLYAAKLLVLLDGRSVYTPLFSGVYWDELDTLLQDIERIEVIRGPGATVWGANAVNGVINIITKHGRETLGGVLTATAGTEERGTAGVRYGASFARDAYFRIYTKVLNRDETVFMSGENGEDSLDMLRTGMRLDWQASPSDSLMVQADLHSGDSGQRILTTTFSPPASVVVDDRLKFSGGHFMARWEHSSSKDANFALQFYYDRTGREEVVLDQARDVVDLDFHQDFMLGKRQSIVWGGGYRYTADELNGTYTISFEDASRQDQLWSGFLQDTITLLPGRVSLTLGSKVEHNDYTGWECQPGVRLLFTPTDRQTLWAAVSRAIRMPARSNADIRIRFAAAPGPLGLPVVITFFGSRAFASEELTAVEAGYRVQPNKRVFLDIAGFSNFYDDLSTPVPESPRIDRDPGLNLMIPSVLTNDSYGETYGVEAALNYQVMDRLSIAARYSFIRIHLHPKTGTQAAASGIERLEGATPRHQFLLTSHARLPHGFELDNAISYVDNLPAYDVSHRVRWDVRLGWSPTESLEISLVGQNVLREHTTEWPSRPEITEGVVATRVERSFFGKVTWDF